MEVLFLLVIVGIIFLVMWLVSGRTKQAASEIVASGRAVEGEFAGLREDIGSAREALGDYQDTARRLLKEIDRQEAHAKTLPPPPPQWNTHPAWLKGDDSFPLQVVGESNYQNALAEICGGWTEDGHDQQVWARLILEDSNPYDPNAVQVQIDQQTVGYLARRDATAFRDRAQHEGLTTPEFACKANIRGGWSRPNDDGNFGVWLDVLLYERET